MSDVSDPDSLRSEADSGRKVPKEVLVEALTANDVPCEWVSWPNGRTDKALLYLHGGGYVFGGPNSHRELVARIAQACDVKALLVDYRLAPENPFPAAVEDAFSAYKWLLDQGYSEQDIFVAGDSAGGGLSAALLLAIKEANLAQPCAAVLISPWADLTNSGPTIESNADADPMLSPSGVADFADHYLDGQDAANPTASPLFGDLSNLAPIFIQVGSTEILLSDSQRLAERVKTQGGQAEVHVWPDMPHVFPLLAWLIPEGKQAIEDIARFAKPKLAGA